MIDHPPLLSPFELAAREMRALGITITRLPGAYFVNSEGTVSERPLHVAHGLVNEGQRSAEACIIECPPFERRERREVYERLCNRFLGWMNRRSSSSPPMFWPAWWRHLIA